ncbi:MAG: RrF2 family transcriptional regulator [Anaerolineae bacterium]
MKITRGTDYGIRGILYLAIQPNGKASLLHEIAKSQDIPETYLAKLLQDLTKAGLVRSHRGAKGGFCLAKPASEITLRHVIEALQGPISLNRCLDIREKCPYMEDCAVYIVLRKAQDQLLKTLDAATLELLAQKTITMQQSGGGTAN